MLKDKLKKTRSSSYFFCSMGRQLKVENEENDQTVSEPRTSSKDEYCSEFHESLKRIENEPEKDILENRSTCKSKLLDTG